MKKSLLLRTLALLALLAVGAWYVTRHADDLRQIGNFRWAYLAPLLAVQLIVLGLNGWMNRVLIERFGPRLPFAQWYGLAVVNALANYLPLPQAGAAVRGAYLKRLHNLSYSRYAATYLFTSVLTMVLLGAAGLACLLYLCARGDGGRISWLLWLIFGGLTALAVLLFPAAARLIPGRRLATLADGYRALGTRDVVRSLVTWRLVAIAVNATGVWLAYESIDRPTAWTTALLMSLAAMASGVANVTPGNAGTAEAAAGATVHLAGGDFGLAVSAYLVARVTQALVIFTLGPVFAVTLSQRKASGEDEGRKIEDGKGGGISPPAGVHPPSSR